MNQPPDELKFWCCLRDDERQMLRELGFFWRTSPDLMPLTYYENLWDFIITAQSHNERFPVFLDTYPLEAGVEEGEEADTDVIYYTDQDWWGIVSEWIADPSNFCPERCRILTYSE